MECVYSITTISLQFFSFLVFNGNDTSNGIYASNDGTDDATNGGANDGISHRLYDAATERNDGPNVPLK